MVGEIQDLLGYSPAHLADAQVFVPDVALAAAFDVVRLAARERAHKLALSALGGDAVRGLALTVRTLSEGWRLVLWPVWVVPGSPAQIRDGRGGARA
jgi:hypothetical protein